MGKNITKKYFIHGKDSYTNVSAFLHELGYQDIIIPNLGTHVLKSKIQVVLESIIGCLLILLNIMTLSRSAQIIVSDSGVAIFLNILNKFGILKSTQLYWFGFFVHNPKYFGLLNTLLPSIIKTNSNIIVFSEYEKVFYHEKLGIAEKRIVYLPYGDWNNKQNSYISEAENYYFSGGYSNRDYKNLISTFGKQCTNYKLIIAGSRLNSDIKEYLNGSIKYQNIEIYTDIDSDRFDELVKGAKACIFPMKYDSGASGQSVLLRCMRYGKLVIASNTKIIQEYIVNEESGILVDSIEDEVPLIIQKIECDSLEIDRLKKGILKTYREKFSYSAITKLFEHILEES